MNPNPDNVTADLESFDPPKPAVVRTGARILRMITSTAAAWLAGFVITAPIKIFDVWRDATAEQRPWLNPLSRGLFVWTVITLALALVSVALLLGPLATLLPSRWVLRYPRIAAIALPVILAIPLGLRLVSWSLSEPGPYSVPGPSYIEYMLFILVFFTVASMNYLRLLRRAAWPPAEWPQAAPAAPEGTLASNADQE